MCVLRRLTCSFLICFTIFSFCGYAAQSACPAIDNPNTLTVISQNNDFGVLTVAAYERESCLARCSFLSKICPRLEIFPCLSLTELKPKDFFLAYVNFTQFVCDLDIHILSSRAHPPTV